MMDWRMVRKAGFSVRESAVGGMEVVKPTASWGLGGSVGRRESIWPFLRERLSGKMYCAGVLVSVFYVFEQIVAA